MSVFKKGDVLRVIGKSNGQVAATIGDIIVVDYIDIYGRVIATAKTGSSYRWDDEDLEYVNKSKGEIKMLKSLKKYYEDHQDIILTVGVVVLLDHFLFGGALRAKIQTTIEKLLSGVEKKVESVS